MKKCPICEEVFYEFDDVLKIKGKIYHENCIEIIPVKYCAYMPGDYVDGFLGEFEEDDKTWAAMVLEDDEYKKGKKYTVTYINAIGKKEQVNVFATDSEDAKEKISQYRHLEVLAAEELREVENAD